MFESYIFHFIIYPSLPVNNAAAAKTIHSPGAWTLFHQNLFCLNGKNWFNLPIFRRQMHLSVTIKYEKRKIK